MIEDQTPGFRTTRRRFVKTGLGGVWLITRALSLKATELTGGGSWSGPPGKARYRFDGLPKVLGQKIFARDFHARDMSGWPAKEQYAMVLRTPSAGRVLEKIDLGMLPRELQPAKTVTAQDLADAKIVFPSSAEEAPRTAASLFVGVGAAPEFMGQPVAILLFRDFETYRQAKRILQFNSAVLQFGAAPPAAPPPPTNLPYTGPMVRVAHKATSASLRRAQDKLSAPRGQQPMYAPPTYLTRYANGDRDEFSQVSYGVTNPYMQSGAQGWTSADSAAAEYRARIQQDLDSQGWKIYRHTYETQELDPMFMEPETGLGWYEPSTSTMNLVLGTQSPDECISDAIAMFAGASSFPVKTVVVNACYPGGGFGGRDVSVFPLLMTIAAAYAQGPVRLAHDRFDQFQAGLKQLGAAMEQSLAVDSKGRFQAVVAKYKLQAGGRNNYSQWIAQLAGYCGGGGYVIPRVSIDAEAEASVGVIAGSMRGFGGPQAAFAIESLIDEIAAEMKTDPIALREKNALAEGGRTVTGYKVEHSLRIAEICRLARAHPLWVGRGAARQAAAARSRMYGVGFALANQAFGTGRDGVMAAVEIAPDGTIAVTSNAVDMGNGAATSLAISTAQLGANAARVDLGDASAFDVLQLEDESGNWSSPRYTASISMSSSACITAFHQVHAVEQASRALLETAVWPAAAKEWGLAAGKKFDAAQAQWKNGALTMAGKPALPLARLAQLLRANNLPTGAMIHCSFVGEWITSRFVVNGAVYESEIDALALKQGGAPQWTLLNRANIFPPLAQASNNGRSLYSPSGTLAAVEVDRATGEVRVRALHTILEAGRVVQPDLLKGQYHGGVAMGVGYALYEFLPHTRGGPGDGTWNLNRYRVAKWEDLPLGSITLHLLEPVSPDEPARGIAESVLCPIAPAVTNAIAAATGKRFRSMPVTPQKIREALG